MALVNERVRIQDNECVGPNLYLMTLSSPAIAAAIEPGQFVHMKIPGMEGHVLRRPFSVYAADTAGGTLDGFFVARFRKRPAAWVRVIRAFPERPGSRLYHLAGNPQWIYVRGKIVFYAA